MTPALARRIALATLDPVMFDIVYDTACCVAAGRPVPIDYGFTTAEVGIALADRAVISRAYREAPYRDDFVTATLNARLGWLMELETDGDADADRRRLDWLEAWPEIEVYCWVSCDPAGPPTCYGVTVFEDNTGAARDHHGRAPTLWAAIDAAMAEWAVQKREDPA